MAKLYDQITQLLDGSVDAAVVLDGERRVLHYNPAYEGLTGLRGRQLAEKVKAGARCYELFKLEICANANRQVPKSLVLGICWAPRSTK